ncbi:hypothetical protein LU293_07230 [Moraxella nasovis]|uniref:hypothetical protein n=1 Tax=Moraxella nasovis TaxID=2904121 RepID=UPI001F602FC6|nr:hypothetical protein [Moraxella nasovis]UNU74354.1 hypothetical protein LU293_07230 [Moraxella nasovis]
MKTNIFMSLKKRLKEIKSMPNEIELLSLEVKPPKLPMQKLVESQFLNIGQILFDKNKNPICKVLGNGNVSDDEETLSIHKMSAKYLNKSNHNGWDYFYLFDNNEFISLDSLRYEFSKIKV